MGKKRTWAIPVCLTCYRLAYWPFCEHKRDDGAWFTYVTVSGVLPAYEGGEGS